MIKEIDIFNREIAEKVLELQLKSYRVEAEIIGCEIPPLKDTVENLTESGEIFYGYYSDEHLCGVLSLKIENDAADIHRLIVHPNHFKKGIAQRLLDFIEESVAVSTIKTATASKNTPAINFYKKNGFVMTKEVIVNKQLSLIQFEKRLSIGV